MGSARACPLAAARADCESATDAAISAVIFFGRHKLRESLGWMAAFWASTLGGLRERLRRCACGGVTADPATCVGAGTIGAFSSVLPLAAWLVAPTLGWVSIAAKLNYDIFALNKSKDAAN